VIVVGKPKRRGCGCVKLGGCRPSGGLAGMGDVTPERLKGEWERVFRETQAKFGKPLTFAQLYKEIAPHLERTNRNVGIAKTMKLRPGQLAELVAAAARLQKVRNAAKVGYANTPNKPAGDLQAEAREAVLAPCAGWPASPARRWRAPTRGPSSSRAWPRRRSTPRATFSRGRPSRPRSPSRAWAYPGGCCPSAWWWPGWWWRGPT
jgi:hypothetical protein